MQRGCYGVQVVVEQIGVEETGLNLLGKLILHVHIARSAGCGCSRSAGIGVARKTMPNLGG
jgi:hypothetical protein